MLEQETINLLSVVLANLIVTIDVGIIIIFFLLTNAVNNDNAIVLFVIKLLKIIYI